MQEMNLPPIVQKPETIRDLGRACVEQIRVQLASLSERAWDVEDARKENGFECFHHTRHIVMRFIHANRDPRDFYSNPSWSLWRPLLLPLMEEATRIYRFDAPQYPKVMFARLAAGQGIDPHVDGNGSNLRTHKIHIPLQTNEGARFLVGDSSFFLEAGRAYEVNNIVRHGAVNRGNSDRVHLIFEAYDAAPRKSADASTAAAEVL
jgi:hypothetical protein